MWETPGPVFRMLQAKWGLVMYLQVKGFKSMTGVQGLEGWTLSELDQYGWGRGDLNLPCAGLGHIPSW